MVIIERWRTKSGLEVKVTGQLILRKTLYSDGWNTEVDCCEIRMTIKLDGRDQGDWIRPVKAGMKVPPEYTHYVGKLALTDDQVAIIKGVRARLEASPQWQAKMAKENESGRKLTEEESRRIGNGLCPKCGTYCFGDCES